MTKTMEFIAVDEIVIDGDLDFRSDKEAGIDELAASIEAFGLMQPITVAPANGDGKHHVVAGRRRLRAFQALGRTHIEVIIDDELTGERAQMIGQIIENLQREDVGPLDEARAFAKLGDYGMKQKDVAAALGVSSSHVSGRLALLKLPEKIVAKVLRGDVSASLATKIARLPKAVRDELAESNYIDDRSIARIENDQKDKAARTAIVEALAAAGVPAAASAEGWGFAPADKVAELAGLGEDDKPKSHEWTTSGYVHLNHFDGDVDELVTQVVAEKAKAGWVTGAGPNLKVMTITSANLDKARKAEQEEQRERAERLTAEREAKERLFEDAVAPIVAAPDKAVLIAGVLKSFLQSQLSGYGNVLRTVLQTAHRMGWELDAPDLAEGQGGSAVTELNHYRDQVLERACKDTTTLVRAIIASQATVTTVLVEQGILEGNADLVRSLHLHDQLDFLEEGAITEDMLSEEAAEVLAEQRAEEAESEDLDERIEAETDRRLEEAVAEADDSEDLSDEEVAAMREEIRGAVQADLDPGL